MKTTIKFVSLLSMLLLTGCVGLIPLPPTDKQVLGQVIQKSQTQFILAGQTTRDDVVAGLGCQFRDSPREAALAYSWEKPAADLAWWICLVGSEAAVAIDGHVERSHWRAFFVAFDDGGKVCRTEFVSLSQGKSLDEQLEDWALKRQKSFIKSGCGIFDPDTGRPRFIDKMEGTATVLR